MKPSIQIILWFAEKNQLRKTKNYIKLHLEMFLCYAVCWFGSCKLVQMQANITLSITIATF